MEEKIQKNEIATLRRGFTPTLKFRQFLCRQCLAGGKLVHDAIRKFAGRFYGNSSGSRNLVWGFTLLEVLVVIAVFMILASIILSSMATAKARARDVRRKEDLNEIRKALELYQSDNQEFPGISGTPNCLSGCNSTEVQPWIPGLTSEYIPTVPLGLSNSATSRYRYQTTIDGTFELDASVESDYGSAQNDGGDRNVCPATATCRYEIGTDLTLLGDGP